ncbi:alpha/beta hydrolase family esterase [Roseobacter sinensis]|uniref:Polyhydroxybutyrate depolymerase n=1 Tax=Roseobacter sinensis TaxID=2931391 RepID=A0ABT3BCZ3_9RHOB|nr:polyhydroxybutyrate depolymerase [Roseobacter sp. WL0113]MCV3271447.1 polyhydroxybutyrate depolymerase [Roseobacter sp. WL0113]
MRLLSLIASSLFVVSAPALACGPDTNCELGNRHYRIAMPEGHDGATPVPAIVFAHGYRGSAQAVMRNGSLRRMASDMGVALIAAKSEGDDWVIPNAPRHMDTDGAPEFDYFDAMLDDAMARFPIDGDRIVATGFSAGGMMTWNLACSMSGRFAGFIPISGTFWLEPPETCAGPVASIVHIHGTTDRIVPLDGRPIGPTHQGKVSAALKMYRSYGGFEPQGAATYGDLDCTEEASKAGDMLKFCLFEGGHSFRTEFVRFGWDQLEKIGRL